MFEAPASCLQLRIFSAYEKRKKSTHSWTRTIDVKHLFHSLALHKDADGTSLVTKLRRQGYDDIELKHALKITYLPSILNHFCRTMTSSCHFFVDKQWRFISRTPDDAWVHCLPQRKGRFCHRGKRRGTKGCGGKGVGGHHARSKVPEDIHGSLRFVNHPGTLPQATVVHPSEFVSDDCRSKINVVNLVS